jgi:hypothetical protein
VCPFVFPSVLVPVRACGPRPLAVAVHDPEPTSVPAPVRVPLTLLGVGERVHVRRQALVDTREVADGLVQLLDPLGDLLLGVLDGLDPSSVAF